MRSDLSPATDSAAVRGVTPRPVTAALAGPLLVPVLGSLLAISACASGSGSYGEQFAAIESLTRHGDYQAAAESSVTLLDTLDTDSENAEAVRQIQREISIASSLERVRSLTLDDQDKEALDLALELDAAFPGMHAIEAWRDLLRVKLADFWFDAAREASASERFDDARAHYRTSLGYDETRTNVQDLLGELDRIEDYRANVADKYYYSGVSHLSDGALSESLGDFSKVDKFDRGNARAKRRVSQVNRQLAATRVAAADVLAKEGLYAAAAKGYLEASTLDPDSEEIARNLEALRSEAKASAILRVARNNALRGDVDKAEVKLKEALGLTALQTELIEKEIAGLDDKRAEKAYDRAVGLERDFQYEAAIEGYDKILESRDFFKDVRARTDALTKYVADAKRIYAEYEAALTDASRLALLRQIEVFWPEYRDISKRIDELSKK